MARPARARRMGTVAMVAAGAFALSTGIAQADPSDTRDQQAELEEELATLNEEYNVAQEDHDAAEARLESIEDDLSDVEDVLDGKSDQVRDIATSAYTGASYEGLHLFFDAEPDDVLSGAADLSYLSENNYVTVAEFLEERQRLDSLRDEAAATEDDAAAALAEADERKTEGEQALDELEDLLAEEEDTQPAAASSSGSESDTSGESSAGSSDGSSDGSSEGSSEGASDGSSDSSGSDPAPSSAEGAEAALEFARAQIGKPYVWGGTGPDGFDCSGLVLRAWEEGGVSLPRVSQDQWNAGTRVDRSELQPGDLMFFYDSSAPTHVGMYAGDGKMVHGSNPAKPIEEVNLADYWDSVYVGAVRPG